ncbi:MAG TPA: hypothetical protein VNH18_26720 [Bryobacteraceae bacterium]|nr:hypothetical protein [Candidatus Limnocylindrales bacterium]HXJ42904.1 hypothetical protein [Bryobacteraceae bacterium]
MATVTGEAADSDQTQTRAFGSVHTIGVGDGHNDATFLLTVDVPIVIRSRFAIALKMAAPRSYVTNPPGPHGWNEAVLPLGLSGFKVQSIRIAQRVPDLPRWDPIALPAPSEGNAFHAQRTFGVPGRPDRRTE